MSNSSSKYLILACDGGGIRGLITALLIQDLFKNFPTLLNQVYLLAGTSTGGIVSLALACGVSADQLVNLYRTQGKQIFTPSTCLQTVQAAKSSISTATPAAGTTDTSWWEYIWEHLEELICAWYTNTGLKSAIQTQLGSNASLPLNKLSQYVLVNTFQLSNSKNVWTPLQLTNLPNIKNNDSGTTAVIDAAMSSSAAPMYFPPYQHPTYGYCADGGVFANNPGTIALTTLIESGVQLENIWMLSLSTGNTLNCYPASIINLVGPQDFGPLFWFFPTSQPIQAVAGQPYTPALPLMSAFFDGTSEMDAYQCGQLLGMRYQRATVNLTQPIALNDYSPATITAMTNSTNSYIASSAWTTIVSWLNTNFFS